MKDGKPEDQGQASVSEFLLIKGVTKIMKQDEQGLEVPCLGSRMEHPGGNSRLAVSGNELTIKSQVLQQFTVMFEDVGRACLIGELF